MTDPSNNNSPSDGLRSIFPNHFDSDFCQLLARWLARNKTDESSIATYCIYYIYTAHITNTFHNYTTEQRSDVSSNI